MSRPRLYDRISTAPSGRFLDPQTLGRISNLELVAKTVVEGFISGLHRSTFTGRSMNFAEHREYEPGDDIRQIDWRVYARSDRYYVKEYEADTNANFIVLLDVSKSMGYGSGGMTKLDYARYLAACLAYFSHKQRDRVGVATFDRDLVDFVPPSAKHLEVLLHTLDRARSEHEGGLRVPLSRVGELVNRRSLFVLLSDLYEEPTDVIRAVAPLAGRGNDIVVFQILDPTELDLPASYGAEFEDMETGERLPLNPDRIRDEYRQIVEAHIAGLRSRFGEHRMDFRFFDTSTPLDYALFHYLSHRQHAIRSRGGRRR